MHTCIHTYIQKHTDTHTQHTHTRIYILLMCVRVCVYKRCIKGNSLYLDNGNNMDVNV